MGAPRYRAPVRQQPYSMLPLFRFGLISQKKKNNNNLQDLLNFDDPLNVEASELYFKNKVRNKDKN